MKTIKINNRNWCLFGFFVIIVLSVLLHYTYKWTNESKIVGLFVPVNESVWEHLKLGYWALFLLSVIEIVWLKDKVNSFYSAKLLGFLVMSLTILLVFYSYTFFTGYSILWIDISSMVLGAMFCQLIIHAVYHSESTRSVNTISFLLLIGIGVIFAFTTYFPPHLPIFKDAITNTYGINKEK